MRLNITHTTRYHYDTPVDYALQKLRLTPQRLPFQEVVAWDVDVSGGRIEAHYADHFGNHVDLLNVDVGAAEVKITAHGIIETQDVAGVVGHINGRAPRWLFAQQTAATMPNDDLLELGSGLAGARDQLASLHELSARILQAVPYEIGKTDSHTTAADALALGSGVCQDHAQIFISAARAAGIPARYISGYLMMDDRVDQDATHAWAEAHVPGLGWVGFDISNGHSPDERYVRVAVGRDARDAAPTEGLRMGEATEQMIVSLQVQQ